MLFPVPPEGIIGAAVHNPPLLLAVVPVARLVRVGTHSALAGRLRAPVRWGGRGPGEGVTLLASRQRLRKRRAVSSAIRWDLLPCQSHLDREARDWGHQQSSARGARRALLPRRIPMAGVASAEPQCPPPLLPAENVRKASQPSTAAVESAEVEVFSAKQRRGEENVSSVLSLPDF